MTRPPDPPSHPRGEQAARLLEEALERPSGSRAPHEPPPAEALAPRFPELEIQALVGAGGMGAVYRARHRRLDRLVALKVLPEELARDPQFAERFAREARTLARLDHPHIVRVHDFGAAGDLYYLVLEYVDGANLRQVMAAGGLSPKEALAIVPQICDALQYAHDQGVVHRDIKPENVLLDRSGRVKIADFGLAKLVGRPGVDTAVTATGQVMGTVQYMAPEQYRTPQDVDHRADIFSLGVVFYEMLTGELPVGRFQPPSAARELDARIDAIVLRALERERTLRYQSANEIRTDVTHLEAPPGPEQEYTARRRHFGRSPGEAKRTVAAHAGRPAAILAALAMPLGLAAVAAVHGVWGGVERGTDDAFRRELFKGVAGAVVWVGGALLGLLAALRGARAPEPRHAHKTGIVLLVTNLAMALMLGLYVAAEVDKHARTPRDAEPPLTVGGLPDGEDPGPIAASVRRTWQDYQWYVYQYPLEWERRLRLYVEADREELRLLSTDDRRAGTAARRLGLGLLGNDELGGRPRRFALTRIDVLPGGDALIARIVPLEEGDTWAWSFPMERDADGAWRFAIGEVRRDGR